MIFSDNDKKRTTQNSRCLSTETKHQQGISTDMNSCQLPKHITANELWPSPGFVHLKQ